jgi:CBS domain-containing membrane protein
LVAIHDIMTRDLLALPASASLAEAARALVERDVGAAPVRDAAGRIVGVLSRSDLCDGERLEAVRAALDPPRPVRAADLMTPDFVAVRASDPIAAAIDLLANESAHRVLVMDDAGELVGLVTAADLLRVLAPPASDAWR